MFPQTFILKMMKLRYTKRNDLRAKLIFYFTTSLVLANNSILNLVGRP